MQEISPTTRAGQAANPAAHAVFLTLFNLTGERARSLDSFLAFYGVRFTDLAAHLGISLGTASKMLRAESMPQAHIARLAAFPDCPIPVELLPAASRGRPGPAPRNGNGAGE